MKHPSEACGRIDGISRHHSEIFERANRHQKKKGTGYWEYTAPGQDTGHHKDLDHLVCPYHNLSRTPFRPDHDHRWNYVAPIQLQGPNPPMVQLLSLNSDLAFYQFLPRGDLTRFLYGWSRLGYQPPTHTLWHMWECFVKTCIGLEYKVRDDPSLNPAGPGSFNEFGRLVSEKLPATAAGRQLGTGLCHFEIDPQNIFIGNYDRGEPQDRNDCTPLLKLGDFGHSWLGTQAAHHDADEIWINRSKGKDGWYTPKQFTAEWDFVRIRPIAEATRPPVAGNFTWKTNLYQFALVMVSIITGCDQPDQPLANEIEITPSAAPDENNLPEYQWDDDSMRNMLLLCFCEKPADRLDFKELIDLVNETIHRTSRQPGLPAHRYLLPAIRTISADLRVWSERHFTNPPSEMLKFLASLRTYLHTIPMPARGGPPQRTVTAVDIEDPAVVDWRNPSATWD
ncbi:hypothetical protein B0H66DRAFT_592909 [Apodospora peruviana]|uniref:Protein kinase domain-containing protein n=1 Tax=Apodospora peruviana TaxID=516989 RepID=A0AAE0I1K6_9PEZI|nr:hypothetical protein B0H66DRAFT_592909 [Apodospora peruviana]